MISRVRLVLPLVILAAFLLATGCGPV